MAIAIDVADLGKGVGDPSATTIAFTTGTAVAASGFIVVSVGWFSGATVLSSVAGGALTWTIDKQGSAGGIADSTAVVSAQAPAGLASGTTITATFASGVAARSIGGTSFTGVAASSPVDGTPPATKAVTPAAAGWASNSATLAAGSVLIATCWNESGNFTNMVTAPSVQAVLIPGPASPVSQVTCYRIEASGGAVTVAGTWSSNALSGTNAVAYLVGAGSTATPVMARSFNAIPFMTGVL